MKKKSKSSKFDVLVEKLVVEFLNIKNIDLLTEGKGKEAFNSITYRTSEIASYKELVCNHFFPATNKAIQESKNDFINSKYKSLLNAKDLDFSETLHDTVRLAYVGLFHKIENYVNEVARLVDVLFEDLRHSNQTVAQWAKDHFNFDLKNWRLFYTVQKINWICTCVKHKDGFPIKEPKPTGFEYLDEKARIKLTPTEFKTDCELLLKIYPLYLQLLFAIAQHKFFVEDFLNPENMAQFPDLVGDMLDTKGQMENKIKEVISLLTESSELTLTSNTGI